MSNKETGFEIREDQRQNWWSIAAVWAGGMICVSTLMIGGILSGGGLSIPEMIFSIIIGYALVCAYMVLIGKQGCDLGLPVSVLAGGALGEKGGRFLISLILALACIGWFGIQSATCGTAFASMVAGMTGGEASQTSVMVWSIIWGVIMLVTAATGFKGLKLLNIIAVPLLLVVCLYGLIAGIAFNNGGEILKNYHPATSAGIVFGTNMTVASFALGGVISADYCRFAKSRADVTKSSLIGVIPAGIFMMMTGALLAIVTGQYDVTSILASIGVPFLGLVALVLATWTTNVTNAFSGGLALSNLLGFDESKFGITTAVAGGIGTLLAAFGWLNAFQGFLSLLSGLVPSLAGVIIADYWVSCKGKKENFVIREGVYAKGLIAYLVGTLVACITGGTFANIPAIVEAMPFLNTPFFIGPINGIVVSFICYVLLDKLGGKEAK